MMRTYHWSVSPIEADETGFVACVREALKLADANNGGSEDSRVDRFRILSRFRGYYDWGVLGEGEAFHGHWTVARRRQGEHWEYAATLANRMSGETTLSRFTTRTVPERTLLGDWKIAARYENDHGNPGRMSDYFAAGRLTAEGGAKLRLAGGLEFAIGDGLAGREVLAEAALIDSLRVLNGREFAMLERLECVKPATRVREIGVWDCPFPKGESLPLTGYAVYGEGVDPRTWWLDDAGRVFFIGTSQCVYVREGSREALDGDFPEAVPAEIPQPPTPSSPTTTRPNILFINTDQQSWDALSGANPHVKTPALDFLRSQGVSFARSYSPDPVCSPARSSWTTGRYTSETGCVMNSFRIHEDLPDIAHMLRHGGDMLPLHSGKWHVDGRYLPESDDFQILYFGRRHIGASSGENHDPSAVRAALGFLDSHDGETPFYLEVGIVDPHDNCEFLHLNEENEVPDPVALGLVDEADLPELPANFTPELKELFLHKAVQGNGADSLIHGRFHERADQMSERQWRGLAWMYYRYVEKADHHVGLLLAALRNSRFRDNTLVIFSSDHGEAIGRHRCIQKFSLYEESCRTPFVVAEFGDRFGLAKGTVDAEHMVSGVDLVPTVLDYAEVTTDARLSGRSLRPIFEGKSPSDWPEFAYVESNIYSRAIIGKRFKYLVEYLPDPKQLLMPPRMKTHAIGSEVLLDLVEDPDETRDVAEQFPDELQRCRETLRRHEETLETRPLPESSRGLFEDWQRRYADYLARHAEGGTKSTR